MDTSRELHWLIYVNTYYFNLPIYFFVRYISGTDHYPQGFWMCGFDDLLTRLRNKVQTQVRNGELTERGLARRMGLSQPHMHNILKGTRHFRPELADRVMKELGLSIRDLLGDEESPRRPMGSQRLEAPAVTASR